MGLESQILLTKTKEGVFRSGQLVTGILRYSIDKPMKFEFITISLKGKGKCWWSESRSASSDSSSYTSYSGKEDYVSLHSKVLHRTEIAIKTGVYEVPFEFQLPKELPSSYNDAICKIKYKIIAIFSKAGFLGGTKRIDTDLQVYGNVKPCTPQPMIYGLTKNPFTMKKPVHLKVEIEKTLLIPGDDIKLNCTVTNETKIAITCIQTKLVAEIVYTSDNKHKHMKKKTIEKTTKESVAIKGNCVTEIICTVPTFANLYTIQHSKILTKEYKVIVTLKFPFPHRDAVMEIPVVIGEPEVLEVEIDQSVKYDMNWRSSPHYE